MTRSREAAQSRIFISYRREDSAYPAGWLFDRLVEKFGSDQVFKDVDSIALGDDFVQVITAAVSSADVLLAVIGDDWLTIADEQGRRRLDDPEDFVRLEIEAALRRDVRVIPILVEGASMPKPEELPPGLASLSRRHALELSPSRFNFDTSKLLQDVEKALTDVRAAPAKPTSSSTATATPPKTSPEGRSDKPPHGTGSRPRIQAGAPLGGGRPPLSGQRRVLIVVGGAAGLLALVIGGVLLLTGSSDENAPDARGPVGIAGGRIAFVRSSEGNSTGQVWTVRPDKSDPQRLTDSSAEVRAPDWSPDGTKIVFTSDRSGDFDLWVMNAEGGSDLTQLTSGDERDGAPSWSPDGKQIAFGRQEPGRETDIWIVEVETRDVRQVTTDPADDDVPDWSTTNRIVFESDRDGPGHDIFTMDPEGQERDVRQVTSNVWEDFWPRWSPDGTRIAFRSRAEGNFDIWTIDAEGNEEPQNLTSNGGNDHHPSWSPDGELIAFDSSPAIGGNIDIFVAASGGGEVRQLVSGPGTEEFPSWGAAP